MKTKPTDDQIVTRFAPSPTGYLHFGSYRTALFNYLYAKKHGGKFLLRIEDTDFERSRPEYEQDIIDSLEWLGLSHDGFTRQSARTDIYRGYLDRLLASGAATMVDEVIRFKNPGRLIKFTDLVRGEVSLDTTDLGDFVIAKNLDAALYHLAVVIDDYELGVSQVIRGEDHIANTARQIMIQEAIGAPRPIYAHLPLILNTDRSKLSKRHGATAIHDYQKQGYLPEAVTNYLALLGWNPGTAAEIFSLSELINLFDLAQVQKSGAIFDAEKLRWFNREHLKRLAPDRAEAMVWEFSPITIKKELLPAILDHIYTFGDVTKMANAGEFDYLQKTPTYAKALLKTQIHLPAIIKLIEALAETSFTQSAIKAALWPFATKEGRGEVLWPMRVALTGREHSFDPFIVAAALGKEETLRRLRYARTL